MRPFGPIVLFCLYVSVHASYTYCAPNESPVRDAELIVAFGGEEGGYLESCGCEKIHIGGIAKRQSLLESLQQGNKTVLSLSLGDLSVRRGRQDEIKMETLVQALEEMQYTVHNLGEKDLEMGLDAIGYNFFSSPVKLLSSNVVLPDTMGIKVYPYVIKEVKVDDRHIRVGILGILSPELLDVAPQGVETLAPSEAIGSILKELKEVDLLVLLSHAGLEETRRLAKTFPEFQLVISGHNLDHPVIEDVGDTIIATSGNKGKHIGLFRYWPSEGKTRLEMVELNERYVDSGRMLELLKDYQQRLRYEDLLGKVEKIPYDELSTYAGNAACDACHPQAFLHWKTTRHATAYETLARAEHEYDPECVACHVTGLYYEGGFRSLDETPELKGVGCEGCHGPGTQHVEAAERGLKTDTYGKIEPWDCEVCHDLDHSSQFRYQDYWQRIAHPKEQPKG